MLFTRRDAVRRELGLIAILIAVTLAVYARTVRFGFLVFDDPRYVTENFFVLSGLNVHGVGWAFTTFHDGNWIPLSWLSLMLDATLYGRWAGGFHATNLLLHLANVLLVFAFFSFATGRTFRSAFVAALFAVHPLHVESVTWIAERKDVLSMLFGLLALCAYVRYAQRGRYFSLGAAFVFFAASLASKQTFVTLPFIFLLLDFWPLGRLEGGPPPSREDAQPPNACGVALVVEKIPFFLLSAVLSVVAIFAQWHGRSLQTLVEFPVSTRVLNAVLAYGLYLQKAFLPVGLAIFYPHPGPQIGWISVTLVLGVLAAITLFALATVRRWPFVLVGWLWFLGTFVPMIGLIQIGLQQMADRYAYLPFLGLYVAIAWLIPAIVSRASMVLTQARLHTMRLIACGVVSAYAGLTWVQTGYWQTSTALIRHALDVTGDNPFGRSMLGDALLAESRVDEALAEYRRTIELAPQDAFSRFHLAAVLYNLRQFQASADQFEAGLRIDRNDSQAHAARGLALCGLGRDVDGKQEFCCALEFDSTNASANAGLAMLAQMHGHIDQAIADLERALQHDDSTFHAQRLLAIKLSDQGRWDEAIDRWRQIAAVAPDYAEARSDLEQALAFQRKRLAAGGQLSEMTRR